MNATSDSMAHGSTLRPDRPDGRTSSNSAVAWSAILAGAVAAAVLSLVMLILGVGLGLSSVSPWSPQGVGIAGLTVSAIVWLSVTQFVASGMGGYLAGRLRNRWADIQGDEVFFRDTAHGFLAWGVASLVTAGLLTSAVGTILGAGANAGAALVGSAAAVAGDATTAPPARQPAKDDAQDAQNDPNSTSMGYLVDSLMRPASGAGADAAPNSQPRDVAPEVSRILMRSLKTGTLAPEDQQYVGRLIAQRTGLSQEDAEKRVGDAFAQTHDAVRNTAESAKQAAEKARKASALAALWFFVSLLIGAFIASLAATIGGRQRDR